MCAVILERGERKFLVVVVNFFLRGRTPFLAVVDVEQTTFWTP